MSQWPLCRYSFESQAELLTEVPTVVGVFARIVDLISHVCCCYCRIVQSLHTKVPYVHEHPGIGTV